MSQRITDQVRRYLASRGGRAKLGDVYGYFASQAAARSVRDVSRAVERLLEHGDLRMAGGECALTGALDTRGQKGRAHAKLWRAAHQRSLRGGVSARDLALLARVRPDTAGEWCREMRRQGHLRVTRRRGNALIYRVAAGAPGPEQPPAFRWPRRGKAASYQDILRTNT